MRYKLKAVFDGGRRWFSAASAAILVIAGFASCGTPPDEPDNTPREMIISAMGVDQNEVLVTKKPVESKDEIDTIGVFGYETGFDRWIWSTWNQPDSLFANRFYNLKLNKGRNWNYAPTQYWPIDDRRKISFFAYWPYTDLVKQTIPSNGSGYHMPSPLNDSIAEFPRVQMFVDTIVNRQVDLLYASSLDRSWKDDGGKVSFQMKHALAGIKFSAKIKDYDQLLKGYTVRITQIGLFDVHGAGTLRLDNSIANAVDYDGWTYTDAEGAYKGQYVMEVAKPGREISDPGRLTSVDITGRNFVTWNPSGSTPTGYTDLRYTYLLNTYVTGNNYTNTGMGEHIMVLPQDIASNPYAMLTVVLEFTYYGNSQKIVMPFAIMLSTIKDDNGIVQPWRAGRVIDYRIEVTDEFITIHTMAHPWKNVNVTGTVVL